MFLKYYLSGGLKFNRLLKKAPHKKEDEKQIKKDYASLCFSLILGNFIVLFVLFLLVFLLEKKVGKSSALVGVLSMALIPFIWYSMTVYISDERKNNRLKVIGNICKNCQEYNKWTRDEKLVDVEHEVESKTVYSNVDIKSKSGHVIGSAEVPNVISRIIRKETYKVTKKCNCCGQIYYHYETRRK